jgi:hypothetical protein
MAKGKPPTKRKGAADKAVGKAKPRKRSIKKSAAKPGPGHNKPPPDPVSPPISSWQTPPDDSVQNAHAAAVRQRGFKAAMGMGTPTENTPFAAAHDPAHLHQVMLKRIAALEETIVKLAALPDAEQIEPKPLDDSEIAEIRNMLAKLKALPPAPAQRPTDAVEAESKLKTFGEKVLVGLTVWAATKVASATATALWASYSAQLKLAAQAIGEWYATLPPL